jgi:hypothetical protein
MVMCCGQGIWHNVPTQGMHITLGPHSRCNHSTSLIHPGPNRSHLLPAPQTMSSKLYCNRTTSKSILVLLLFAMTCTAPTGIPGSVEFEAGRGGLPTVVLKHACGATAQVRGRSSSSSSSSSNSSLGTAAA